MIHRITPVNDVGPQCARLPPRDITLPRARGASDCIWVARILANKRLFGVLAGRCRLQTLYRFIHNEIWAGFRGTSWPNKRPLRKTRLGGRPDGRICMKHTSVFAPAQLRQKIVHMEERLINRLLLTNHERFGCTEKDATAPLGDNSCVDPTI